MPGRKYNYRGRSRKNSENYELIGSFVDIAFEIVNEKSAQHESIRFDTKIHYLDKGEGETLLLIHGLGQSLFTWHYCIDYFAENGYRVLALDLAGSGYSGHPNIYYTVEENALVIAAFMDALKIRKAHVAGFSTGALSAVCYAYAHPARVDKLILVSPGGPNENYPFALRFLTTWLGRAAFMLNLQPSALRSVLHNLYFDVTQLKPEVVDGYFEPLSNRDVRETLVMNMLHYDDQYVRSLLKSVRHKTLVFSGVDDSIHDENMVNYYAQTISGAQHVRVRNCAHFVHEEKPERFNEELLAFLKNEEMDGKQAI